MYSVQTYIRHVLTNNIIFYLFSVCLLVQKLSLSSLLTYNTTFDFCTKQIILLCYFFPPLVTISFVYIWPSPHKNVSPLWKWFGDGMVVVCYCLVSFLRKSSLILIFVSFFFVLCLLLRCYCLLSCNVSSCLSFLFASISVLSPF